MASYPVHLGTASVLGSIYGAAGIVLWQLDWGPVFLGAGLTAIGGILPDLDSDSGIPVRELFGVAAVIAALFSYGRFLSADFSPEQTLVLLGGIYLFVRYPLSNLFRKFTVHRGMFHSVPGMFIAGLAIFLLYDTPPREIRVYLAVGTMLGFLSHLVLDELYSVDFMGLTLRLNKYAGSALKFVSPSWLATTVCLVLLLVLSFLCLLEWDPVK